MSIVNEIARGLFSKACEKDTPIDRMSALKVTHFAGLTLGVYAGKVCWKLGLKIP
jgi:hypothetical protein